MSRAIDSAVALALALSGCSSAPPVVGVPESISGCEAEPLRVTLMGAPGLNATAAGVARPLEVRVVVLSEDATLRKARFRDIWLPESTVLEDSTIYEERHTLYPNGAFTLEIQEAPEAASLAVIALYRQPDGEGWKSLRTLGHYFDGHSCGLLPCAGGSCAAARQCLKCLSFELTENRLEDGEARLRQAARQRSTWRDDSDQLE